MSNDDNETSISVRSWERSLIEPLEWTQDVAGDLDTFVRLARTGDFQRAREFFSLLLQQHDRLFPVQAEYADVLLDQGAFGEAEDFLTAALERSQSSLRHEDENTLLTLQLAIAQIHTKLLHDAADLKAREALGGSALLPTMGLSRLKVQIKLLCLEIAELCTGWTSELKRLRNLDSRSTWDSQPTLPTGGRSYSNDDFITASQFLLKNQYEWEAASALSTWIRSMEDADIRELEKANAILKEMSQESESMLLLANMTATAACGEAIVLKRWRELLLPTKKGERIVKTDLERRVITLMREFFSESTWNQVLEDIDVRLNRSRAFQSLRLLAFDHYRLNTAYEKRHEDKVIDEPWDYKYPGSVASVLEDVIKHAEVMKDHKLVLEVYSRQLDTSDVRERITNIRLVKRIHDFWTTTGNSRDSLILLRRAPIQTHTPELEKTRREIEAYCQPLTPISPMETAEQHIFDKLLNIRDHLSILKQDKSTYVKSQDVFKFYDQVIDQVEALNKIRVNKRDEQNRVDTVLDHCFQLISLFFLTIGRNQEALAVYSAISTVKRLLDHLKEAGFYSAKDLESIDRKIEEWQVSVNRGQTSHSEHLVTLLHARIDICRATLKELQDNLSRVDPDMLSKYEKLVSILRSLSACNAKSKFPAKEVDELEHEMLKIQDEMHAETVHHEGQNPENAYASRLSQLNLTEGEVLDGRTVIKALLMRCTLWLEIVREKQGKIDERFQELYDQLLKICDQLEKMNLTQASSLRETDLYSYQCQLDKVDEARVNGNFIDALGRPADLHAQRTLLYLLRRSYAYIFQYFIQFEPVSEALLPIYNQVLTLKRCLQEVQRSGGVDSPRELYSYSMKLNSIDNMKKDGKFIVGDDIPEGQASVTTLLNECFEMAYELRTEAEERKEASEQHKADKINGVGNRTSKT